MWEINNPAYFWNGIAWGSITIVVAAVTLTRVCRGSRSAFAIMIVSTILMWGFTQLAKKLCTVIYRMSCLDYPTEGNLKPKYIFLALENLADIHLIIFSLKYLEKGIDYSRVIKSERFMTNLGYFCAFVFGALTLSVCSGWLIVYF